MFLISTALTPFWKMDGPVLFLGEWCRTLRVKPLWSKLDFRVAPYHWDDRTKLFRDYVYLQELYERCLPQLSAALNSLHRTDFSHRYWRILLGPWLNYFIPILFDRYESLRYAKERFEVSDTRVAASDLLDMIPQDMEAYPLFFTHDAYNQALYDEIIRRLDLFPRSGVEMDLASRIPVSPQVEVTDAPVRAGSGSIRRRIFAKIASAFPHPYLIASGVFGFSGQARLEILLGQIPFFPRRISIRPAKVQQLVREKIRLSEGGSAFERLLHVLIPRQIPVAYVENYPAAREAAKDAYPKTAKVIYTENADAADEGFKFWAAEQLEKGAVLGIGQHGGHLGTGKWNWYEDHQLRISDRYLTWGWKRDDTDKTDPAPATRLIRSAAAIRPDPRGPILFTWWGLVRYASKMFSAPVAGQCLGFLQDQIRFLQTLSDAVRRSVLLRFYPSDFGWEETQRLAESGIDVRISDGRQPLETELNQSRLFVGTYNATTFLETFSADYPSILFWNPDHWELRPDAEPYFDALREAGILFDTPEQAARKVEAVHTAVDDWWTSPEVQTAKDRFCRRYGLCSPNWLRVWRAKLHAMASAGSAAPRDSVH